MKILITGVCGFVGSSIARYLTESLQGVSIIGIDNLSRKGSEWNRDGLRALKVQVIHGDVRLASDLECIPKVDWVIDAAGYPSVLGGSTGNCTSRQLFEHNLLGTINLLEFCRKHSSGFLFLSSSRVYSIAELQKLTLSVIDDAYHFEPTVERSGVGVRGISESFSTQAPVSMYGASKLSSELIATEYGLTYDFPVWINRCGLMAGAGQFGRPDQGIIAFWIHSHCHRRPLQYIGFGGSGNQVRDVLHPDDLSKLVVKQIHSTGSARQSNPEGRPIVCNVAGGSTAAISLRQLSHWCDARFGIHIVDPSDAERPFDLPWVVLDSALAKYHWDWQPEVPCEAVLEEIALHAESHPNWLELSN